MNARPTPPASHRRPGLTLYELLAAIAALGLLGIYFARAFTARTPRSGSSATSVRAPALHPAARAPAVSPARVYHIQDLGTLGGDRSAATAINNRGEVVGTSYTADGTDHAFLWIDARMCDLGTLGGKSSSALALNDSGQIVGQAETRRGLSHAFRWSHGRMRDLGTLGGRGSVASAINNRGEVVGTADTADGQGHAFLFRHGRMRRLKGLSGYRSEAAGINDRGQIAGTSHLLDGSFDHAFVYDHGRVTDLNQIGAGWFGASACAINDRGQVLGGTSGVEQYAAAVWDNRTSASLGLFTCGCAVNSNGVIVGCQGPSPTAADRDGGPLAAVVWQNDKQTPLDALLREGSEWTLEEARGVNDRGQIVGVGQHRGKAHAFLLTPR